MTRRGQFLFALMCLIWGIPYLLIKVAVRALPAPTLVFARTAPAAVLLLPVAWRRDALRPLLPRWKAVLAYSAIEVAGPWLLLSTAEKRLSSSFAGLLIATVPLIAAVLAVVVKHEEVVDGRRLAGLLIGLFGVAVLVGVDVGGNDVVAVAQLILTAVGYAVGPVIISRRFSDLPGLGLVAASVGLTALAYAPVALLLPVGHVTGEVVASVCVLTVICTAVAFLVFFVLIIEVGPSRATVITYVNPAVAVTLGVLVLGEPFTVGIAIGFPLILAGSVLATGRPRSSRANVAGDRLPTAEQGPPNHG